MTVRFALFCDDYIGHANPLIGMAQRLSNAGHSVTFFGPGKLAQHVARHGCHYVAMPALLPRVYSREQMDEAGRGSREDGAAMVARRTADIIAAARTIAQLYAPHVAVFDAFMLCLLPAFAMLGMHCVAVSIAPLLTPDPAVPPYTSGLAPPREPGFAPTVAAAWKKQEADFSAYVEYSAHQERTHGWSNRSLVAALSRASGFPLADELRCRFVPHDLHFRSIPEMVVHAREFDLPRSRPLTDPGAYLGPCTPLAQAHRPARPGPEPLLVCQLGTAATQFDDAVKARYRRILQVIASRRDWRAIVAISSPAFLEEFKAAAARIGDRIVCTPWIDQVRAVAQATVLITNAGDSSVKEAILAGTPMLALPHHFDQHGVAARVAFHGLGIGADLSDSDDLLESKISALMNDRVYAGNLATMRRHFLRYDDHHVCERVLVAIAGGGDVRFSDAARNRWQPSTGA